MLTITTDQARQRFSAIPSKLQDAIFSEQVTEIISQIADQNHISEDKIFAISDVAGWVLLGFIHPEDFSKELQDEIDIPAQTASEIGKALDAKLFGPLSDDLLRVYAPAPGINKSAGGEGPTMMQDLTSASPMSMPAPEIISQTAREAPRVGAVPIAGNQTKAAPPPMAPKKLPDVGWSRSTLETPVVKLQETRPATPQAPLPVIAGKPSPIGPTTTIAAGPKPAMPAGPMGEFERMNFMQPKPKAPETPVQVPLAPKASEPAPVMLHEDASSKAEPKAPEFHIQLPGIKLDAEKSTAPPRAAMMELNKNSAPATPSSSASTPAKVVHYSEYKPTGGMSPAPRPTMPVSPISIAPSGPRQITELTGGSDTPTKPPASTPFAPSISPSMPKPPAPEAAVPPPGPAQKVVFKNYTESQAPQKSPFTGGPQMPASSLPGMPPAPKPPMPPPSAMPPMPKPPSPPSAPPKP